MTILKPSALAAGALLFVAACSSTAQQPATTPVPQQPVQTQPAVPTTTPAQTQSPLQPPAGALRAAESARITGTELGTMWTFENPPLEYWARQYNFRPGAEWLEHVRLASVRFGTFCSASFVSPNGLVATNHHCARECVEAQSTGGTDYVANGFYAATRREERLCPGLFLDQLVEIQNVTDRVTRAAAAAAGGEAQSAAAQSAERKRIEEECASTSKLVCQVVPLYHGGQYQLYKYRRFAPVKLVFAPELQAGFFGGDPDNFTYPRYALDVSFVRAYDPDSVTPAKTPQYFRWRAEGADEGELLFVTGNPGTTNRMATVSQLMYERVYRHPFLIAYLEAQRDELLEQAKQGPEAAQHARQELFEIENSLKAYRGQFGGLLDTLLMGRKIKWEREFHQRVNADANTRAQYGDVWQRIQQIQEQKLRLSPASNFANIDFLPPPHVEIAGLLVRYIQQSSLPEAQRAEQFRGERMQQIAGMLGSDVPLDTRASARAFAQRLAILRPWLAQDNALLASIVRSGESPEQAAQRIFGSSRIGDPAFRQALIRGGAAAVDTSTDPVIALVREMENTRRRVTPEWQQVLAAEQVQQERLARALFAAYGTSLPPDATFTLRISDGVVQGYPYNGTLAPFFTTYYGLYGRAAEFRNKDPFTLPKQFSERRASVNMSTPLDFVSTNDITGGNSGSPIIDREARVVGLAFDSNIEGLPNQFLFTTEAARTVSVHSAGVIEALRNVYRAPALVQELIGTSATGTGTR